MSADRIGLDAAHRRDRTRLLAELVDGTPCPYCGGPMIHPRRCENGPCFYCRLNRDHVIPRALGGADGPGRLAHTRCDSQHGVRLRHHLAGHAASEPPQAWWLIH